MYIKNPILRGIKEYLIISIGLLMYVVGWTIFLVPNNLIGGGVTGVSSIIQYATGGFVKLGFTYLAINIVLLVVALFILGKGFGVKTVFAIILVSFSLNFFQTIMPESIIQTLAIENGKLMSTIMGGMMSGIGIGMSMSQGGSTGGTDIIALIINKYRNVSPGKLLLSMDVVIILSSLIVPSYTADGSLLPFAEKIINVVYGLILIVVNSTVVDIYLSGTKQSIQVFIISKKAEQIANAITNDLHRGVTVLHGEGWYSKQPVQVLMLLTLKSDQNLLFRYIKSIDPDAFLSVSFVTGVYGQGFDPLKVKAGIKKD